jgi:hypothetical protein
MSAFDAGFNKRAQGRSPALTLLKGLSILAGVAGGSLAGGGVGDIAKGLGKDSFADPRKGNLRNKLLDTAPGLGSLGGALLGGGSAYKAWKKIAAFDAGFNRAKEREWAGEKSAFDASAALARNLWGSMFSDLGNKLALTPGAALGEKVRGVRKKGIEDRTMSALLKSDEFEQEDTSSLSALASASGVGARAAEVAAGTAGVLAGYELLKASRPVINAKPGWARQVADRLASKVLGPGTAGTLPHLALALAGSALATGYVTTLARPAISEAVGNLAAKLRSGDIQKSVDRHFASKTASGALQGFDRAKTAASLIGVMPGVTSGLRTMKSFGKIRTARPVSGQSIGPRSKPSPTPSPTKPPNAGTPGAANSQVLTANVPKPMSYGSRLMGSWI